MNILDELKAMEKNDNRIDEIKAELASIGKRPVYPDFRWKAGEVIGILRYIIQNPAKRQEMLLILDLPSSYITFFSKYGGNLPYISKGIINYGREMDATRMREFLPLVYDKLGIDYDSNEFDDLTEERWRKYFDSQLESIKKTIAENDSEDDDDE